jgi:hypothetical protein
MNKVISLTVLALAAFSLQAPASDRRIVLLALHPQIKSGNAKGNMTDPAQQLTAGTGIWNLKSSREDSFREDEVNTYTFKSNHDVIEVRTNGQSVTERWSIQTMGRDNQLQIGSQLYQLFFKTEGGTTEMRLGKLANSKAEPSIFMDYKLSQHREP